MKTYNEDWEVARQITAAHPVPRFTDDQSREIADFTKSSIRWFRNHPWLHNTLNLLVLFGLFAVDLLVLLGAAWYVGGDAVSTSQWWMATIVASLVHGFVMYSVVIFTVHEGAAHDRIVQRTGPVSGWLGFLANNASRLFFADPEYYAREHVNHHGHFGTPQDGSFTNYVRGRRFLISLLPLSGFLDFNDYRTHCDTKPSRSRTVSMVVGSLYALPIVVFMITMTSPWLPLMVFVLLGPWFGTTLDRLRESTEHNLMSLEARHGARNLGLDFWGLLLGGGPWGQPCHLSHHLAPALPWYQQCLLHRRLKEMMTLEQRRYFMLTPLIGYPRLLWQIIATSLQVPRHVAIDDVAG